MIVDLPDTTTSAVSRRIVTLRADVGSMALSRVLTLVVIATESEAEGAIATAMAASRQHPSRIVVVVVGSRRGTPRLDAQLRVGGDAGASEVVVLQLSGPLADHGRSVVTPLLLTDSPIVAWWPGQAPNDPSGDPIGAMAQRRITDAVASRGAPKFVLARLAAAYVDGDTDLAWSRVTLWRGVLAAALDQAPFEPVTAASVVAAPDSPSGDLLAGWLAVRLRCPVTLTRSPNRTGIISVRLERASGPIDLVRPVDGNTAVLTQANGPQRAIALPHRSDAECLSDELRRLDPDEVYEDALRRGIPTLRTSRRTAAEAERAGATPSVAAAKRATARIARQARLNASGAMIEAASPAAAPKASR